MSVENKYLFSRFPAPRHRESENHIFKRPAPLGRRRARPLAGSKKQPGKYLSDLVVSGFSGPSISDTRTPRPKLNPFPQKKFFLYLWAETLRFIWNYVIIYAKKACVTLRHITTDYVSFLPGEKHEGAFLPQKAPFCRQMHYADEPFLFVKARIVPIIISMRVRQAGYCPPSRYKGQTSDP